jgi:hypothetical protein
MLKVCETPSAQLRVLTATVVVSRHKNLRTAAAVPQAPTVSRSVPIEQSRPRCIRCRKGARVCVYPEDEITCTACERATSRCKLPTLEEAAALDARCQPCIIRGLARCDRKIPCNGCVRRNIVDRCGQLSGQPQSKKIKREVLPSPELEDIESAEDLEAAEDTQPPTDNEEHYGPDMARSDGSSSTADALTLQLSPQCIEKLHMSGRLTVLDESGTFKATYNIIRVDDGAFISDHSDGNIFVREEAVTVEPSLLESPADNGDVDNEDGAVRAESYAATFRPLTSMSTGRFVAEELEDIETFHSASSTDVPDAETKSSPHAPSLSIHNNLASRPRRSRARVSYVQAPPSDVSDQDLGVDTESDTYESFHAGSESEVDDEQSISDMEKGTSSQEEELLESTDIDEVEPEPVLKAKPRQKPQNGQNPQRRAGKGIDHSLPPLHDIHHIFEDLTLRAVELGLCDALKTLAGRPINVATMCSGTESPLIALNLISQGLPSPHA